MISYGKYFQKRHVFKVYFPFLFGVTFLLLGLSCLYIVFKCAIKYQGNILTADRFNVASSTISSRTATPTLQQYRTTMPTLQHSAKEEQCTTPTLKYSETRELEPVLKTGFRKPHLNPARFYPNTFVVEDESKSSMQSSSSSYPSSYSSPHHPLPFVSGAADYGVELHRSATPTKAPENQEIAREEPTSSRKSIVSKVSSKASNPLRKTFPKIKWTQPRTKLQFSPLGDLVYAETSLQKARRSEFGGIAYIEDEITEIKYPKLSKRKLTPESIESEFSSSSMEDIFDVEVQAALLKQFEKVKIPEASDPEQPGCSSQLD